MINGRYFINNSRSNEKIVERSRSRVNVTKLEQVSGNMIWPGRGARC